MHVLAQDAAAATQVGTKQGAGCKAAARRIARQLSSSQQARAALLAIVPHSCFWPSLAPWCAVAARRIACQLSSSQQAHDVLRAAAGQAAARLSVEHLDLSVHHKFVCVVL